MWSCKQTSRLVSLSQDRPLRWYEWLWMWSHLWLCEYCQMVRRQVLLINSAAKCAEPDTLERNEDLSPEAKKRMQDAIAQATQTPPDSEKKL